MAEQDSYLLAGPAEPRGPDPDEHTWKPLRFLNLYRFTLASLFAILYQTGRLPSPLGSSDAALFYGVSLAYVGFALFSGFTIRWRRPEFPVQVYLHLCADILAITLLMHASGGMESGLGVLLVVGVGSAGMLTQGRTAVFFAALAALALLLEQVYASLTHHYGFISYPRAGILGGTFFATAIVARVLANRIRETEALAAQRGIDLANMARLTEYVIQQMDAGVLVVDEAQRIRLMNGAAWRLLGRPSALEQRTLASVSPDLAVRLDRWRDHPDDLPGAMTISGTELLPRFVRIGEQPVAGALIFLEDATAAAHDAQQLKLASLGRLTASIAHEVRNPLGAISHAGELLAESEHLDKADHRLTTIITQQVQRVNGIIESVLQLSRRDRSQALPLDLGPWLDRFVREFTQTAAVAPEQVAWEVKPPELRVRFDANHLHQILWNLCQNGLHHAPESAPGPKVSISAGVERGRAFLDVRDAGAGVPVELRVHLFEPFFTTASGGTGLGLYISRELAQCNRARLDYLPEPAAPSRFRLSFGPPEPTNRT